MSEIAQVVLKQRGQMTVPARMRKEMGVHEGEELLLFQSEGRLTVVPKVKDPLAAAGMLGRDSTADFKKLLLRYRGVK